MNPFAWSFRAQFFAGFVCCAALLGYALYVEHGMLMMPCPLCILQRIAFVFMGVFFLLGAIIGPRPGWLRIVNASLVGLGAVVGAESPAGMSACSTCRPMRCQAAAAWSLATCSMHFRCRR